MGKIDELSINTIRMLSIEAIEKANSGHPGLPLGCAPMAFTLWKYQMKHNPNNPNWINRDRFVLSAGHGSMLLYSLFHIFGYGLDIEEIKNFRQLGSKAPGHPEYGHTIGVETTTGPLGQGLGNAVGMAIAETFIANRFNKDNYNIIDHYTYVIAGDGCLMEGITSEASSLAGTLKLGKLIVLYDSNNISIEGSTDIAFDEDTVQRYKAYHWQVIEVDDGNDIEKINMAIAEAKAEKEKPSIIVVKNIIGYGCVEKQGKAGIHGTPLGEKSIKDTKDFLNWKYDPFIVPEEVKKDMVEFRDEANKNEEIWNESFKEYENRYPETSKQLKEWIANDYSESVLEDEKFFEFDKAISTREASGEIIGRINKIVPNFIGGSADLSPSNKTYMKGRGDFSAIDRSGANLHFGVREHAMASIANGIYLHGGLNVFAATFFIFCDYMKGAMRLSALMKLPIIYVLTHDSIGVGEDGPTHQPIEQLASLRSIPNMTVFRPADAKETAVGWLVALAKKDGPTSLILSRQKLPLYNETSKEAIKGAYILKNSKKEIPDLILIASGSEVELIYNAQIELEKSGIDCRVVSMPSFELFEKQSTEYKEKILPRNVINRIAVEAGTSFGWYKYIGLNGEVIAIDDFGASGKAEELFIKFGFTTKNIIKRSIEIVNSNKKVK